MIPKKPEGGSFSIGAFRLYYVRILQDLTEF